MPIVEEPVVESKASAEIQREAEAAGWIPPSRFKGEPDEFRDADEYLERAKTVLPIVNQKNRELRAQLDAANSKVNALEGTLKATQVAVKALEDSHAADVKEQVDRARAEVKAQLVAASESGDHVAVADLTSQLVDLNEAEKAAKARDKAAADDKAAVVTKSDEPGFTPEFKAWLSKPENAWFGLDKRKTGLAMGIAQELREEATKAGRELSQADLLAKLDEELAEPTTKLADKVAAGNRGGTNRMGAGRAFRDLPAEARDACHDFNSRVVGPNRKHKTVADWEKSYADKYFAEEARR